MRRRTHRGRRCLRFEPRSAGSIKSSLPTTGLTRVGLNPAADKQVPTVDRQLCLACGKCAQVCPVNAISLDTEGNPLPPGDYLFSLVIVRSKVAYMRSRWFTSTVYMTMQGTATMRPKAVVFMACEIPCSKVTEGLQPNSLMILAASMA